MPLLFVNACSLPAVQLCGYAIERVVVERKRVGFSTAIEWVVFAIGCLGQLAVFGTVAVNLYFGDSGNVLVGQSLTSESYDGWKVQGILVLVLHLVSVTLNPNFAACSFSFRSASSQSLPFCGWWL